MLIWARACVYARTHGHALVWPEWAQLNVGAWLRWERDKRTYGRLFHRAPGVPKETTIRGLRRYPERLVAEFESSDAADAVLCFESIEPGFAPLFGHRDILWKELCAIALDDLEAHRESSRNKVGFGVRLGDFKKLGWGTPVSWFEDRLRELRAVVPEQEVWIFSDGTDRELAGLLADPLVSRAPESGGRFGSSALEAIVQISGTRAMVVTGGSSLYRWGVFLGGVPVIAHAVDDWHAPIWASLSPCGVAITGDRDPSGEDWARVLSGRNQEPVIR